MTWSNVVVAVAVAAAIKPKSNRTAENIIYNGHTKTGKQTIFDMMINIKCLYIHTHGAGAKSCKGMDGKKERNEWCTPASTMLHDVNMQ